MKNDINTIITSNNFGWKEKSKMWGDKIHRISSYIAMFPPRMANFFIDQYSKPGDLVVDPFSGRGTTCVEARLLDRNFLGGDLNPYAFVLSKAKSTNVTTKSVTMIINDIEKKFKKNQNDIDVCKIPNNETLRIYYSDSNLKQIYFIREELGKHWRDLNADELFVLSVALGLMHGPMRKDGSSMYFSLSMSNAISMSPNYVKKYAKKNNLKKPETNVFSQIMSRCVSILAETKIETKKEAQIELLDACELLRKPSIKQKVDLIFTSPPYLDIINYTRQNWLKLWLLGYDKDNIKEEIQLSDNLKHEKYVKFMTEFMISACRSLKKEGLLIMVMGEVNKKNSIDGFEDMWKESISGNVTGLKLFEIYEDDISQESKTTNAMGTRAGKANRADKIFVFKKKD